MPFEEVQQITFSCAGSSFSETSRDLDEQVPYSQCMSIRSEANIFPSDGEEFSGKSALSIGFQRPTRQSGATLLELQLSCSSIIGRKHRFAGVLKLYVQMADVVNGRTKRLSLPRAAEECLEAISREWLPPACVIKLLITRGHQKQSGVFRRLEGQDGKLLSLSLEITRLISTQSQAPETAIPSKSKLIFDIFDPNASSRKLPVPSRGKMAQSSSEKRPIAATETVEPLPIRMKGDAKVRRNGGTADSPPPNKVKLGHSTNGGTPQRLGLGIRDEQTTTATTVEALKMDQRERSDTTIDMEIKEDEAEMQRLSEKMRALELRRNVLLQRKKGIQERNRVGS